MDELIHLSVTGSMAILMTKVDAKIYENYKTSDNGKPEIYAKLTKSIYEILKSALIFGNI